MNDIDHSIAERVMGWKVAIFDKDDVSHYYRDEQIWETPERDIVHHWHPSTNIEQAFMVVEKMREKNLVFGMYGPDGSNPTWGANFVGKGRIYRANADTAAEAICKAALKAVEP